MKFNIGDEAEVISNGNDNFLKHFLEIGKVVKIVGPYTGWKNTEAYYVSDYTEPLLAEELGKISSLKTKK